MEQLLIKKNKLKNNGPPVKVALYMGEYCEYRVQLQWTAERVGFIKSWSEFVDKADLKVDDTVVFTPADDGFQVEVFRKENSCSSIGDCKKHRNDPYVDPRRR
jgi:hypothetical protein